MNARERVSEIDPKAFRRVMGRFATGVTVITAETEDERRGMTANAFMSGSLEPPLCVVSVAKRAHMHAHLTAAGRFGVNILATGQQHLATHFAGKPDPELAIAFDYVDGIPLLADSAGSMTAEVIARHDCGDHTIFIGHILTMAANERAPLVFHAGRYGSIVPREPVDASLPEFW